VRTMSRDKTIASLRDGKGNDSKSRQQVEQHAIHHGSREVGQGRNEKQDKTRGKAGGKGEWKNRMHWIGCNGNETNLWQDAAMGKKKVTTGKTEKELKEVGWKGSTRGAGFDWSPGGVAREWDATQGQQ
jgi:hypothetical protein